ncbi:MAG TPA: site-specific DNA-methyltransferase [Candidatus Anammoximicrobium sp.]|nr:site-specific DNA-methyltransferase [Candidatus Anammoximicrobium sp.]
MGHKLCHENEAPFPEALAEWFIRSFCPPGGTVLDPFVGSGTTAAVALMHGRNAIGIDVRQEQIDLARRRIASQVAFPDGSSP